MKTRQLKTLRGVVLFTAAVGMASLGSLALARGFGGGFGGFHGGDGGFRDDGFGGGSFRDNSFGGLHDDSVTTVRDSNVNLDADRVGDSGVAVARGPEGGGVAVAGDGADAVRGPGGDWVARGPDGAVAAGGPNRGYVAGAPGWGGYYGPGRGGAVAAGAVAGLAVGAVVASLPAAAERVAVANQEYYVADGVYYRSCYRGSVLSYCVVNSPY